jgi:hypothetical protein
MNQKENEQKKIEYSVVDMMFDSITTRGRFASFCNDSTFF